MDTARCIRCSMTFTSEQVQGVSCCPNCGTTSLPLDPNKDLSIRINVHELRILGIWAENYAVSVDNKNLDNPRHDSLKETVGAICDRLELQLKELGHSAPLTLSREFKQVEQQFPGSQLLRDGREEV